jgi:putative ATP-dependent endonuclease of OLD family
VDALQAIIAGSAGLLDYDSGLSELVIRGALPTPLYNQLLVAYHGRDDTADIHGKLRSTKDASLEFIPDADLTKLETFARRIRGEVFFANKWLLVEGQSEYHIVHGMAKAMGYDFDEHGVSVIDFQNNGNPECFAALGRALGYPWVMIVDGDQAGTQFLAAVAARNFTQAQMTQLGKQLPNGALEDQLVADGLQTELKAILTSLGNAAAATMNDAQLVTALKDDKSGYAAELGALCAESLPLTQRMPQAIREAIETLRGLQ